MLSLLGANHRLPLFHMDKRFIWIIKKKRCNEFKIGYTMNTNLNINKAFRKQVDKCIKTTLCAIKKPHIKATFLKIKQEC